MKRFLPLLLALAMSTGLLACSSAPSEGAQSTQNTGPGASQATESPQADSTKTDAPASGETITLQILSTIALEKPEDEVEKQIIKDFEDKNPDIKIELIGMASNERNQNIMAMASSGTMPDVFALDGGYIVNYRDMDLLTDMSTLFDAEYLSGFDPLDTKGLTVDGVLYGIPMFKSPMGLLYRKDWLDEAGIPVPKTWTEFVEAARKLTTDTDGDGKTDRWGVALVGTNNGSAYGRFFPVYRSFGVNELYEKDGKWVSDILTDKSKQAMEMFTGLVKENLVPPGVLETSYKEAVSLMGSSKTAMMTTGPHSLGAIYAVDPQLKGKIFVAPLPMDTVAITTAGGDSIAITKTSTKQEAAVRWVKHWLSNDMAVLFNEVTGRFPTRSEAMAALSENPAVAELVANMPTETYIGPVVNIYPKVQDAYAQAWQAIMTDTMDTDAALKFADELIQEAIAEIGN